MATTVEATAKKTDFPPRAQAAIPRVQAVNLKVQAANPKAPALPKQNRLKII